MGEVKDQMTKTKEKRSFGGLFRKKTDRQQAAHKFVDYLDYLADEAGRLLEIKSDDLKSEGENAKNMNTAKRIILKQITKHIDLIIDLTDEYTKLGADQNGNAK